MCGSSWSYIPDDTVSLHSMAMFILLAANCRAVNVDFHRLRQSVMLVFCLKLLIIIH